MNILIAEDHEITAKLIANSLNDKSGLDVVGIANNGKDVFSSISKLPVDIILMDINMPKMDGIQATQIIKQKRPDIKVLVVSGHSEAWVIKQSINAGAMGYINKKSGYSKIAKALEIIYNGDPYLDEVSLESVVSDYN